MENDYLWTVAHPRNSSQEQIDRMNDALIAFDPNRKFGEEESRDAVKSFLNRERPSFAQLVQSGMEP